jgi:hypothetical protein
MYRVHLQVLHVHVGDAGVPSLGFALRPAHQLDAFIIRFGGERSYFLEREIGQDGANKPQFQRTESPFIKLTKSDWSETAAYEWHLIPI